MGEWDDEVVVAALSARARRGGAAYAGPGAGTDVPDVERPPIAFTGGLPDPTLLPAATLAELTAAVLASEPDGALQYGGAQGWLPLREWLAEHWSAIEGTSLTPAHYTMANGSAGALVNVCDTFLDSGDVAGVEAPSFPGSVRAIRSVTPRIEGLPVDADGLVVDALEDRLAELEAAGDRMRIVYTIPNFQNPTGATMSLERRRQLLEVCDEHGTLIVEDDAYGELPFGEAPPPSLYSLAAGRGVVKIGTFSKIVAPGLRAGWCQATPRIIDALLAARNDMGTSPLILRVLARYGASGILDDHISEIRAVYARKCATMLKALEDECTGSAVWNEPTGGFFVWLTLADTIDPLALVETARAEGVTFVGGQVFFAEHGAAEAPRVRWGPGNSRYLRLAFSYVAEDQIGDGVGRLGRALLGARRG